jgi:hypothetical protein
MDGNRHGFLTTKYTEYAKKFGKNGTDETDGIKADSKYSAKL